MLSGISAGDMNITGESICGIFRDISISGDSYQPNRVGLAEPDEAHRIHGQKGAPNTRLQATGLRAALAPLGLTRSVGA